MDVEHKLTIPLILLAAVLLAGVVFFVALFANVQQGGESTSIQNRPSIAEREAILHSLSNSSSPLPMQQKQAQLTQLADARSQTYSASGGTNTVPPNTTDPDDPYAAAKLMVLRSLNQQ